jgi:protein SCO1/2
MTQLPEQLPQVTDAEAVCRGDACVARGTLRGNRGRRKRRPYMAAALAGLLFVGSAFADAPPADRYEVVPEQMKRDTAGVGITEKVGNTLPLDADFIDTTGHPVKFGEYFGKGRPLIIQMGYFTCPMICDVVSHGIMDGVKTLDLNMGTDYDVLYISINPDDRFVLAREKKQNYVDEFALEDAKKRAGAIRGWNFLVGSEGNIKKVADAIGFGFYKVEGRQQWSHPPMIVLATSDGTVSRYFYGNAYPPRLLRMGLVEAGEGKVGSAFEQFAVSYCYHFDSYSGKYTYAWMNLMRFTGGLTVTILGLVLGSRWVRDIRAARRAHALQPQPVP